MAITNGMYERTYTSKVFKQNTPKEKKEKHPFPWKRFLWVVAGLLFVTAVVVLIRAPKLQVSNVEIIGANVTDPEDVSTIVNSYLEGHYLYFLPRSSMLLVPTAVITRHVRGQFPRFSSVDIRRKGVDRLVVSVVEHEGKYLWCENQESCFFMTKDGVVFAPAPFFSGDAYEKIFVGQKKDLPFRPMTDDTFSIVESLRERLPTIEIVPKLFRFVSEHQVDIIFVHNGHDASLIIDPSSPLDETLEDLATGLATEPLKSKFNDDKNILEYLDARFANKVVYKFK